jgi:TPR repeat protein
MARFEVHEAELAAMGAQVNSGDFFFQLGITYSVGCGVPQDRVAAHKWFNLAAQEGKAEAIRYRQELAGEMTKADVGEALRQAREYCRIR